MTFLKHLPKARNFSQLRQKKELEYSQHFHTSMQAFLGFTPSELSEIPRHLTQISRIKFVNESTRTPIDFQNELS